MKQRCSGLIFDDDIDILESMATNLGFNGLTITGMDTCGCNADNLYKEKSPDFVITDLSMPDCDGNETIRKIDPKAKIFVFTGLSNTLEEKVEGVFHKSKSTKRLIKAICQCVCDKA